MTRKTIANILVTGITLILTGCNQATDYTSLEPPAIDIAVPEETEEPEPTSHYIVEDMAAAGTHSQLILVTTADTVTTDATVSYFKKDGDTWSEVFLVDGHVGVDGIGEASEYVSRTPAGLYHFTMAFGKLPDPGCKIGYTEVDEYDYWVDDPESPYYNQFVRCDNPDNIEWSSAEHLSSVGDSYNYVLALDYNSNCVPGAGSAIFLHCYAGVPSQGCITIPQQNMEMLLQNISTDCGIIIDTETNITNY